ncbi:MAG TPA: hypothetical protein VGH28_10645 [Polyangiaceae bacterium]|jgi:virginiamycin B lyase
MLRTTLPLLLLVAACAAHQTTLPVTTTSATVVGSSVANRVEIREYKVPTADAFPHDVAVGPKGELWFTEERANKIGRLDRTTGTFDEYTLETAAAAPHGLAIDRSGNVWFSANAKGFIGKLDPATGRFAKYALPDRHASDPHSLAFDRSGTLWFTVEKAGFVGKLDTETGEFALRPLARENALPYGIAIGKDGAPYVAEFGANQIARIDPHTMDVREFPLPQAARPRRVAVAPDGSLYFTDFARGKIGRLDTATGVVAEWSSPSGPRSQPYGLAITDDGDVWFAETGVQPSRLVRFEPRTKQFGMRAIPGGGVIRNMAATPEGRLFFASSDTNRVLVATPGLGAVATR